MVGAQRARACATYVHFVGAPAGLIGINIAKIHLDFGASPGVFKIPGMRQIPGWFEKCPGMRRKQVLHMHPVTLRSYFSIRPQAETD